MDRVHREQQPGAPVPHWSAGTLPTLPAPSAGSLAAFLAEHGLGWNEGEIVRLLLDWAVERRPDDPIDEWAAEQRLDVLLRDRDGPATCGNDRDDLLRRHRSCVGTPESHGGRSCSCRVEPGA